MGFKKGDTVKIVKTSKYSIDPRYEGMELEVLRKLTDKYSSQEYVKVSLPQLPGMNNYHITSRLIDLRDVIKVNSKIYQLKKEIIGGEEDGV